MKICYSQTICLISFLATSGLANPPASTKVYFTNSEGNDISVIDLATRQITADIEVCERVHGVCASADGRAIFITIESENNLKVIYTATNKVVDTIALTGRPNQCASTLDGHYVGVPIRDKNSVDIFDMKLKKVVKVLPVPAGLISISKRIDNLGIGLSVGRNPSGPPASSPL